jgi:hypothetical protein
MNHTYSSQPSISAAIPRLNAAKSNKCNVAAGLEVVKPLITNQIKLHIHLSVAEPDLFIILLTANANGPSHTRWPINLISEEQPSGGFLPYFFAITETPPIYGRSTSGMTIEPSACW